MAATKKNAPKKSAAKKGAAKKAPTSSKSKSADIKTRPTAASVEDFIAGVAHEQRRQDAGTALGLMKKWTGLKPKMWGPSIIGFGSYHYKYESGREGDMCMTGFSPRSSALVFYILGGVPKTDPLFKALGKHKLGGSCLYVNQLTDIDLSVLEKIVKQSVAYTRRNYPTTP